MLASLLLLMAAPAQPVAPAANNAADNAAPKPLPTSEPDAMRMKPAEIRAFNEGVPKTHPFYIRCKTSPVTGSLAAVTRICRSNSQWDKMDAQGNQNARDTYEAMQGKAMNTSN